MTWAKVLPVEVVRNSLILDKSLKGELVVLLVKNLAFMQKASHDVSAT